MKDETYYESPADFIDTILAEAEEKEAENTEAYFDMAVKEIAELESLIEQTNLTAEKDIELIKRWALNLNAKRTERIDYLKEKLEAFIRSTGKKTIDLPHGILKLRQKPDKVEVTDLELFLKNASKDMVTIVPEQIKPSLSGIKRWIKMTDKVPQGVRVIKGDIEFSLKLKQGD